MHVNKPLVPSAGYSTQHPCLPLPPQLHLAFYCDAGRLNLQLGSVLWWHNPCYHMFIDGKTGARMEDQDLGNIAVDP